MNKIRSLLPTIAIAALATGAAIAQTVPTPPEVPPSQDPVPAGQLSTPMQDRGATGDLTIDDATRQRAMEREAARLARQRDRGPEGELSVPYQDRGGSLGSGQPAEASSSNWSTAQ